jgi:UDP-N-acetylglucosamine:LPS N-acetylglucosamine transferase
VAGTRAKESPDLALVLTAGMGEGHNGVARELQRRLEASGWRVQVVDVLQVLPLGLGRLMRAFYSLMVRRLPWLYEAIYRLWFRPSPRPRGPVSPVTVPIERFVVRFARAHRPQVVVSTFHLCSQVLGQLRSGGRLQAPAVSVVVDLAVHRLWVHPGVDHCVCFHPNAAAQAALQGQASTSAPGPVVRPAFARPEWDRASARASLGLGDQERAVLVVGGSWGVGQVRAAAEVLSASASLSGLVVCGNNRRLYAELEGLEGVRVFGWVEDMARLMVACDAMVDNAGGLTCMEALAVGTPVVAFRPLPGHGRANLETMAASGLVAYARGPDELEAVLEEVCSPGPRRQGLVEQARLMFDHDAAEDVVAVARGLRLSWPSPTRNGGLARPVRPGPAPAPPPAEGRQA